MGNLDNDGTFTIYMDEEMNLGAPALDDAGDGVGGKIGHGPATQSVADTMATDELLAHQLAAEEKENFNSGSVSKKRRRSPSTDLTVSEVSDYSEFDDEATRPHTQYFSRPGEEPLEVSWDLNCDIDEIPANPAMRSMVRRIVAQVALERGHEIAWIMKCYLRNRWVESNVAGISDHRYLQYAEHIEAEFGYNTDESSLPEPGALPYESATIYIGPEGEQNLERITLWRKSGGPSVVWGQNERLKLGHPRLL